MAKIQTAFALLSNRIKQRCKDANVPLDTYDPDFILGVIMVWLDENDAILTSRGIERNTNG